MPIDFRPTENSETSRAHFNQIAHEQMRPISRKYDVNEHERPKEWIDFWWNEGRTVRRERLLDAARRKVIEHSSSREELNPAAPGQPGH